MLYWVCFGKTSFFLRWKKTGHIINTAVITPTTPAATHAQVHSGFEMLFTDDAFLSKPKLEMFLVEQDESVSAATPMPIRANRRVVRRMREG